MESEGRSGLGAFLKSGRGVFISIGVLTLVLEALTCLSRFGLGISMKENEAAVKALTFGVRIHHGYVGILLGLIGLFLLWRKKTLTLWTSLFIISGSVLVLTDIIHHFLILLIFVGRTEFP